MDLIVSNPPYVPLGDKEGLQREVRDWEPHEALFAGPTGVELYQRIDEGRRRNGLLRPCGWPDHGTGVLDEQQGRGDVPQRPAG